jgi:hypothetical protein
METMSMLGTTALSVCLGLGLSAATGFRVFVPLLLINLASRGGWLELSQQFAWMGETPALVAFGIATLLEIGAYYVPWLDNLMDSIASPAAVVAGTVATASVVTGMDPTMKWILAVVAGGGVAGAIQTAFVGARQVSLLTTAGFGNPVVSSLELLGSIFMSILSFFAPLLAAITMIGLFLVALKVLYRRRAVHSGST